jgi:hypothetical protein
MRSAMCHSPHVARFLCSSDIELILSQEHEKWDVAGAASVDDFDRRLLAPLCASAPSARSGRLLNPLFLRLAPADRPKRSMCWQQCVLAPSDGGDQCAVRYQPDQSRPGRRV